MEDQTEFGIGIEIIQYLLTEDDETDFFRYPEPHSERRMTLRIYYNYYSKYSLIYKK